LEITVRLDRFLFLFLVAVSPFFFVMMRRVFAVYPCCAIFAGSALRVEGKYQHVLFWGGLRGALALALAVGLPDWVAQRETIISVTFGVVAFSIFVQGVTMTPILRHFGEISPAKGDL